MSEFFLSTTGVRRSGSLGFSLIELMVAMFLGILVAGGIITLFSSTSKANRVQAQLARMQELGRFAVQRMADDVEMTSAPYCSHSGGPPQRNPDTVPGVERARDWAYPPVVYAASMNLPASAASSIVAAQPYSLPASSAMAGYECTNSSCTPVVPSTIPAMGTSAGARIPGTDVLTVRYLRGRGWEVGPGASQVVPFGGNQIGSIALNPQTGEQPASYVQPGDLIMVADCNKAQVFAVDNALAWATGGANMTGVRAAMPEISDHADTRIYDFTRDFVTVTYFLELRPDDNPDASAGRLIGTLMRMVNGQPAEEMARGVEAMDLRYGFLNDLGQQIYLTADQVNSRAGGAVTCANAPKNPPPPPTLWADPPANTIETGCLWRSINSIEVSLLLNSVDLSNLPDNELTYIYPPTGSSAQTPPATMSNGLDRNMMRRSFTSLIAIRNNTF